jgi:integrase
VQLGAIGAPEIERWRQHLLAQGNQPSTINRKVSCLRSMLNDAALHGCIEALPPIPRQLRVHNTKDRVITKQELELFCSFFREIGEAELADMLVFLTLSCARWGEAERLRGEDVDLERCQVTFWKTKNGHPRTIAIGPKARSVLEAYVPAVPRQLVWGYPYWRAKHLFNRAKGHLGLAEDDQLTIHCTRHTAATRMAQAGVPLQQIAAFGGWRSLAAVQRYMHLQTHQLTGCVAAIEG